MNNMDEIRTLTEAELEESILLGAFAFQYEDALSGTKEQREQFIKEKKSSLIPNQIWGYFTDGRLAAKMRMLPLHVYIHGKTVAMCGIASVASWPEYRRKGMIRLLLENALKLMKEQGQVLSLLHPFSIPFYRKFGWEVYVEQKKYMLELQQLPRFKLIQGHVIRVGNDYVLLNGLYEQYARGFNGTLLRTEEWWNKRIFSNKSGHIAVCYNVGGLARGYLIYQIKEMEMNIHEMVFLDEEARKILWNFVSNHDSMLNKVYLKAPMNDQLPFLLEDSHIKQEIHAYFMARIVDIQSFIELFPFIKKEERQSFQISVEDRHAPWNQGKFELVITDGKAKVRKLSNDHNPEKEMSCSIATFTAMMLGYQKPNLLNDIGRLTGDKETIKDWGMMIPHGSTHFMDFF